MIRTFSLVACLVACLVWIFPAAAAEFSPRQADSPLQAGEEVVANHSRSGWVAVPIPFSNPTIGVGLGAMLAYVYPLDTADQETPESFTAVGGFWSDSGSDGAAVVQRLYLGEDFVRVTLGGGTAEFHTDFYGIGNDAGQQNRSIAMVQKGDVYFANASVQTWDSVYVGVGLGYAQLDTRADVPLNTLPHMGSIELNQSTRLTSYGLTVTGDWRNDVYTPTAGTLLEVDASFRRREGVTDGRYRKYQAALNHYLALTEQRTLALRVSGCYAQQDAPFYDLCMFGANSDLRGYSVGRFRDRAQVSMQLELRQQLSERWGVVAFAGSGQVSSSFSDFNAKNRLASVGAGIRFRVSREPHINFRVDYARGEEEETLHISVSEAF